MMSPNSSAEEANKLTEHHEGQPELHPGQHPRLSLCRKLLFGLAAPPLQMTSNICGFYFSLYLLEVAHLVPAEVSVITFSGRVWDAVTDPLVGQLVFRTRTRCGRTKPWLAVATVLGPVSFLLMWQQLPGLDGGMSQFALHFLFYLAYCGFITCYHVPYTSSTMLISANSKDKDGATACRIGFELLFTIIGTGVFGAIVSANLSLLWNLWKVRKKTSEIYPDLCAIYGPKQDDSVLLGGAV